MFGPAAVAVDDGVLTLSIIKPNAADVAKVPAEYSTGVEMGFLSTAGLVNLDAGGNGTAGVPGKVIEHEDGEISVPAPGAGKPANSILVKGWPLRGRPDHPREPGEPLMEWHGYIDHGIWRQV